MEGWDEGWKDYIKGKVPIKNGHVICEGKKKYTLYGNKLDLI